MCGLSTLSAKPVLGPWHRAFIVLVSTIPLSAEISETNLTQGSERTTTQIESTEYSLGRIQHSIRTSRPALRSRYTEQILDSFVFRFTFTITMPEKLTCSPINILPEHLAVHVMIIAIPWCLASGIRYHQCPSQRLHQFGPSGNFSNTSGLDFSSCINSS